MSRSGSLKSGRRRTNQAIMFDSTLQKQLLRRHTIALYLKTAIEKERSRFVTARPLIWRPESSAAQSFICASSSRGLGLIGASEVLPIAEDSGQIRSLEYFALDKVGQCIAKLTEAGKEFDSIAPGSLPSSFCRRIFWTRSDVSSIPTRSPRAACHRDPGSALTQHT